MATKKYVCNYIIMNVPFYSIRRWYLKNILGIKIGRDTHVGMSCYITGFSIEIGDNTVINKFTYLDGRASLRIGNNVNISNYCYIQTLTHDPQDKEFKGIAGPVTIEDNVWVGARAIILTGVKLNEGCVIGAGAVVTEDIPPYTIAVGVPAKVINKRTRELAYKTVYSPLFG